MSKAVVLVIDASRQVGQATVQMLSENFGSQLEIIAGVESLDKVHGLSSLVGVTVVLADMRKPGSLAEVLKKVTYVFILTPDSQDRAELTNNTTKCAKAAGVQHIVVDSNAMADLPEKIFGKQYSTIEKAIVSLGVPYTILRLPIFMEYNFHHKYSITTQSVISTAVRPTQWFHEVTIADAGLVAACVLASPQKHAGQTYMIVSDRNKYEDVEKEYSIALGRTVKYTPITYEHAKSLCLGVGMPDWQASGLVECAQCINDGLLDTSDKYNNTFREITGKNPTKFTTWLTQVIKEFQ